MELITNYGTWGWVLCIILLLIEAGRIIFYHIQKKETDKAQANAVFKNTSNKKEVIFRTTYNGPIFFHAKNKFEFNKKVANWTHEQQTLDKKWEETHGKSKK